MNQRYIAILLIIIVWSLTIWWGMSANHPYSSQWWFPSVSYDEMCFVDSCIPYDGQHSNNKQRIDREIAITLLNESQFVMYHRREPLFFPRIRKKLQEAWLPEDLVYLAVAESSLIESAVSPAWAAGIWQFMPGTAKDFGLRVDKNVDERFHLQKSTRAAIEYLTKLHERFGSWTLAAAAYNRWWNWLRADLNWQYADDYYDAWLNEETARYVFRIIAIKYLMENRYDFLSKDILGEQYVEPSVTTVTTSGLPDIAQRAKGQWTTFRHIKELNPRIRSNVLPTWNRDITVFK